MSLAPSLPNQLTDALKIPAQPFIRANTSPQLWGLQDEDPPRQAAESSSSQQQTLWAKIQNTGQVLSQVQPFSK